MNIINRLIKLANKIDQKDPKLADKLEKTASNWSEDPRSQWLPEGVSWDMPYLDRYLYQPKYQTNNIPSELVQHFKGYQEPWGGGNQTAQTDLTHAQSDIAKIDEALKNPNLTVQQKQSLHAYKLMFMSQGQAARQTLGQYDPRNTANNISQFYSAYIRPSEAGYNNGTTPWDTSGQPPRPQGVDPQAKWNPQTRQWSSIGVMGPLSGAIYDQNGKLIAQSSLNSINMIKTANTIDKENPKLADRLEKTAYTEHQELYRPARGDNPALYRSVRNYDDPFDYIEGEGLTSQLMKSRGPGPTSYPASHDEHEAFCTHTPEGRAKIDKNRQSPEWQAKMTRYRQTPEGQEMMREMQQITRDNEQSQQNFWNRLGISTESQKQQYLATHPDIAKFNQQYQWRNKDYTKFTGQAFQGTWGPQEMQQHIQDKQQQIAQLSQNPQNAAQVQQLQKEIEWLQNPANLTAQSSKDSINMIKTAKFAGDGITLGDMDRRLPYAQFSPADRPIASLAEGPWDHRPPNPSVDSTTISDALSRRMPPYSGIPWEQPSEGSSFDNNRLRQLRQLQQSSNMNWNAEEQRQLNFPNNPYGLNPYTNKSQWYQKQLELAVQRGDLTLEQAQKYWNVIKDYLQVSQVSPPNSSQSSTPHWSSAAPVSIFNPPTRKDISSDLQIESFIPIWKQQIESGVQNGYITPEAAQKYLQDLNNERLIGQSGVSNSINMIKTANAIDKENPKLADKLTKAAANMLNMYVPQNVLEQGWGAAGGGSVGGSLGGFHAQLELNTMGLDPASKNVAISLMGELVNQLPPYKQWVAAHQNLGADPQAVYQALGVMQQLYQMGIQDPSNMGKAMVASGPLDLQFASKQPSANHRSWGISSSDIMNHEIAHAQGKTSTPEAYMQMAVPDNKGIGGNVNPVAGYYKTLMENFMADQGKQEYGPNLDVWSRVVKEKAPQF